MKKILIAIGCLFLSACSTKQENKAHIYIKCWEQFHDTIIYSGWTDGHGVGMGTSATKVPFVNFKDEHGEQVVIVLTDRICAVAAE